MTVVDDLDPLLASAAHLYYVDHRDQREIGSILGVSRSTVSRLLKSARERGIVRISVTEFDPRDREREAVLRERFGLHHVVVVRTPGRAPATVRRAVGYFSAPAVAELIRPGAAVGLAGGRTLAALIGRITPSDAVHGVAVVQLMGNIGPSPSAIDAVELSRELAQRLRGTFFTVSAPAVVQDRRARDMLLAHDHIRLVWGLFGSLALAFVGVGTLDESLFVERGVFTPFELDRLRRQGVVGEICGRLFDRDGRECATEYRDRVLSIDLDVLRGRPEVVGVTNGPGRAAAVRAAIRGRLITSLVIDDAGAEAILAGADER